MDTTQLSLNKRLSTSLKGFAFASVISLLAACGGNDSSNDNEDSAPDAGNKTPVTGTTPDDSNTTPDSTPPVITLNGEAAVQLEAGNEYIEAGATAEDDVDGEVSVSIEGSVDINKLGEYTLTYAATDSSGNSASNSRTVTVVDTTPPIITLNGESDIQVEAGSEYTDAGAIATDALDGDLTVTIAGSVNTRALGEYTLEYTAYDTSGNSTSINRTITVEDTLAPTITLIGEANIELYSGETYAELGAIATDNLDTNVHVTISGSIDSITAGEYSLTYSATDSSGHSSTMTRTVTVLEFRPFITTWKTENDGKTAFNQVEINTESGGDFTVDWGDGFIESGLTQSTTHTYDIPGTYTIKISGNFSRFYFNWGYSDAKKLLSIEQWGDIRWSTMEEAFIGAENMVLNATDTPDLAQVTNMMGMFEGAKLFDGDLNHWDVSNITNMSGMFLGAQTFNGNISDWDTSSAIYLNYMFHNASSFNGDISRWDVSSAEIMDSMFGSARSFNRNISNWNVSSVDSMSHMFRNAASFNSDLSNWDVSSVVNMNNMFLGAEAFNGDISSWDVSSVEKMDGMFKGAKAFNRNLSEWDVSNVTHTYSMFWGAEAFNQDISNWNVSNVTNMNSMFYNAKAFNSDLSNWDVSNVSNMRFMFGIAESFNADLSNWDVSSVTNMSNMFHSAKAFNSDLSNWDVSNVTNMENMFCGTDVFNSDLSGWDVSSVNYMNGMFCGAKAFESDLSNWDVSKVVDMHLMFSGAEKFNSELNNWDVSNVRNMQRMFYYAFDFNRNISSWNVSKVTNMNGMFWRAEAFDGDISSWDVSGVTDMGSMFTNADSFNQNLSNWDISKVEDMEDIFDYSGLSTENYDSILNGWASLATLQGRVQLGASGIQYSTEAEAARSVLVNTYGWTVTDGGLTIE